MNWVFWLYKTKVSHCLLGFPRVLPFTVRFCGRVGFIFMFKDFIENFRVILMLKSLNILSECNQKSINMYDTISARFWCSSSISTSKVLCSLNLSITICHKSMASSRVLLKCAQVHYSWKFDVSKSNKEEIGRNLFCSS